MAFFTSNSIMLILFFGFFAVFLFRRSKWWINIILGLASLFLAIAMRWSVFVILLLSLFIIGIIFTYAQKGGGAK